MRLFTVRLGGMMRVVGWMRQVRGEVNAAAVQW